MDSVFENPESQGQPISLASPGHECGNRPRQQGVSIPLGRRLRSEPASMSGYVDPQHWVWKHRGVKGRVATNSQQNGKDSKDALVDVCHALRLHYHQLH